MYNTELSLESHDLTNPEYLVQFAAENKLELVRAILVKHPDQVSCLLSVACE